MKKIDTIEISDKQSYVLTLQAIVLFFIGAAIFTTATGVNDFSSAGYIGIPAYIGTLILHELLHGLGFLLAGAKPSFGVGFAGFIPIAYATSDSKIKLPGMLLTAYLPLVTLSVFFVLFAQIFPQYQAIAMIGFLANFSGAVGDIWISSKAFRYIKFKDVEVLDTKKGLEIYSNNKTAEKIGAVALERESNRSSFGRNWAISSLAILAVQLFVPAVLGMLGFEGNFRLGTESLFLFETVVDHNGATNSATFSIIAPLVIGFILAATTRFINKDRLNKK